MTEVADQSPVLPTNASELGALVGSQSCNVTVWMRRFLQAGILPGTPAFSQAAQAAREAWVRRALKQPKSS